MDDTIIRIVQITDTHLFSSTDKTLLGVDTRASFLQVLAAAKHQLKQADALLLTGDLAQDEAIASYQWLAQQLQHLSIPYYWQAGNHDNFEHMQQALQEKSHQVMQRVILLGNWQIILLNSAVPQHVAGRLSAAELTLLQEQLEAEPTRHSLICLHHPVHNCGAAWLDNIKLENAKEFLQLIKHYPQVRSVLCGHIHQKLQRKHRGVLHLATPSTCIQFKPRTTHFALDDKAPGFRWLELHSDGTIKTKVKRLKQFSYPATKDAMQGY